MPGKPDYYNSLLGGLGEGLKTSKITLAAATPTKLGESALALSSRALLAIYNDTLSDVYYSDNAAVNNLNGFPLSAKGQVSLEFFKTKAFSIYVYSVAGGDIRIMEAG